MKTAQSRYELIFATGNAGKVREITALLPGNIRLLSLKDIGFTGEIPETENTIEGNAILKAKYIKERYGLDCFADDTGLEVEALGGAPGVHSARYAGAGKDGLANMEKLLKQLGTEPNRNARFKTVIALSLQEELHLFTGICSGNITYDKKGSRGFGYDPVFQPKGKTQTFAQMDLTEKSSISHRGAATRQLVEFLSKNHL